MEPVAEQVVDIIDDHEVRRYSSQYSVVQDFWLKQGFYFVVPEVEQLRCFDIRF